MQGLIDFLVSKHKVATLLREKLIFKIVPMMNPDGVFLGNSKVEIVIYKHIYLDVKCRYYRQGSLFGADLNRVWDRATEFLQPTVQTVKDLILSLAASTEQPLDFVLDLHASNSMLGFYVIGNSYDSVFRSVVINLWCGILYNCANCRNERHIVFPKMLAQNCKDFSTQNTMYNKVIRDYLFINVMISGNMGIQRIC